MTQTLARYERYLSDLRGLPPAGPSWLQETRSGALERFSELGFPTARRGNEKWKYTNVAPIANTPFAYPFEASANGLAPEDIQRVVPWDDAWTNLVFLDGRYSELLSSTRRAEGIAVTTLGEAIASGDPDVERHLAKYADFSDDGFTALNTAFVADGAFIRVPDGASVDTPIHLVFVSTDRGEPTASHPRVLVVAGAGSSSTIIESYIGLQSNRYFTNAVAETVLLDGSQVDHYRLLLESDNAYHVGTARVRQCADSTFTSRTFEKSVGLGRYDLSVLMDGPNASCNLSGLYMTSGTQHVDNFITVDHAKPYSTSRLLYKGILDGKSRAVFGGTVWVRKGAIKTDSMQSDKNLVLSPDAEVDSKPALFIYADDVKCGHGATAGNIDRNSVFYLLSRGIDLGTASRMLIYGFASEIIDMVRVDSLRDQLERLFLESLPSFKFEF